MAIAPPLADGGDCEGSLSLPSLFGDRARKSWTFSGSKRARCKSIDGAFPDTSDLVSFVVLSFSCKFFRSPTPEWPSKRPKGYDDDVTQGDSGSSTNGDLEFPGPYSRNASPAARVDTVAGSESPGERRDVDL